MELYDLKTKPEDCLVTIPRNNLFALQSLIVFICSQNFPNKIWLALYRNEDQNLLLNKFDHYEHVIFTYGDEPCTAWEQLAILSLKV